MKLIELTTIKHLHHAYIVAGEGGAEALLRVLENRGVKTVGNPDLLSLSYSELLVDEVRDAILSFASLNPVGEEKHLVISFSRATDASQNALLKAVEESLGKTTFFFCVEHASRILPTLRSRCITLDGGGWRVEGGNEEAEEFLKETYAKRLARVEKMAGYISKTQDKLPVRAFAKELLHVARAGKLPARALRDILDASGYLSMQGASAKAALSHLAVTLPRMK